MLTNQEVAQANAGAGEVAPVFALDIGTRSIIGIVGVQENGLFRVLDMETREHTKRAMFDGQIEDIDQVAQVAGAVKTELERRLGFTFQRVCVAAAGRALRTMRATFEAELPKGEPVSARTAYEMEMGAVANARAQLEGEGAHRLYCVGHAVVRYHLDDYPFLTIVNHRGSKARVEIIATFLPNEVVESLYTAMSMIGLEVGHMTLEPIAAMNAVIPTELRLMNLALVDIGAGTSDIAISDAGSVSAYTMATVAGDEITESIIHKYLVDFKTAESLKHAAASGVAQMAYHDILGFEYTVELRELLETIRPAVEELCTVVCDKILEANGKAPSAVFLVGGGSQVPLLCEAMAERLGIDPKKVAVGGNNFIKRVADSQLNLEGPEYATPLGIALTAVNSSSFEGFFVTINGKRMRVFRGNAMTVMDVLLLCGYKYADLMGKSGKNITYQLNGQKRLVRGGHLVPAQIYVNGVSASISTPVANGDEIEVHPAVAGEDAHLTVADLEADPAEITVTFNGTPIVAGRRILVNGCSASPEDEIHDLDQVEHYNISTLSALCAQMGLQTIGRSLIVGGIERTPDYRLQAGDQILCVPKLPSGALAPVAPENQVAAPPSMREVSSMEAGMGIESAEAELDDDGALAGLAFESEDEEPVDFVMPPTPPVAAMAQPAGGEGAFEKAPLPDNALDNGLQITVNGERHVLPRKDQPYQFLDMLNLVDIDPTKPQGNIILRLNGREASYLEIVNNGDEVEICWDR